MPTHSTYSSSVDVATGAVLSYGFDFYLNGVIPLEIERLWFSDSDFSGRLGYGVHSIFDVQLKIDEESIGLLTKEGDSISFPRFFSPEETYLNIAEQMEARCTTEGEYYIWNRMVIEQVQNTFKQIQEVFKMPLLQQITLIE